MQEHKHKSHGDSGTAVSPHTRTSKAFQLVLSASVRLISSAPHLLSVILACTVAHRARGSEDAGTRLLYFTRLAWPLHPSTVQHLSQLLYPKDPNFDLRLPSELSYARTRSISSHLISSSFSSSALFFKSAKAICEHRGVSFSAAWTPTGAVKLHAGARLISPFFLHCQVPQCRGVSSCLSRGGEIQEPVH
jgi:hypothetical protein